MSATVLTQARLDDFIGEPMKVRLGKVAARDDIKSSISPFYVSSHRTSYPEVVIQALVSLYKEYNERFRDLVEVNREWETDYQYCFCDGTPCNFAVQVDMAGLPDGFLYAATAEMTEEQVRENLRFKIFEIENSLAMYQFLEMAFLNREEGTSKFKTNFRSLLDEIRRQFGKPIALLAVTDQKYEAMKASEFGKMNGEKLSPREVKELSGFDYFFSPDEFRDHVRHYGDSEYLLYARTSDPVSKLRKPGLTIEHPLLADPETRRLIKANTLTMNIDDPAMGMESKINDTKEYMPPMGMAYPITSLSDMLTQKCCAHLKQGKSFSEFDGNCLCEKFEDYLNFVGASAVDEKLILRCKPMKGAYGCYGHVRGALKENKFRNELRRNIRKRGPYVVQPEMPVPTVVNEHGQFYTCIDRNFMAMSIFGQPRFLGGFRSLMPMDSIEADKGRNHGNKQTVWAEII